MTQLSIRAACMWYFHKIMEWLSLKGKAERSNHSRADFPESCPDGS